jgi:Zn-dependent M28 family amino/carboxypeptidase
MRLLLSLVLVTGAIAAVVWYMVVAPGRSWAGPLPPFTDDERALALRLRGHVTAIASREHNMDHPDALEDAARYIEAALGNFGYEVQRQSVAGTARNIEVEIPSTAPDAPIAIIGAHYDSVFGAPGANDNGSGVAAALELARLFGGWRPSCRWRIVLFVNEEMPYFKSESMGSRAYALRAKARGDPIAAMYSLETIGYYSDAPGSQRYPFLLGLFYPDRGDFLAFVANLASRPLLHRTIAEFRAHAQFPSEGVAAPAFIPGVDWSDQWSFWREGYRAVMITDTALYRYPHYHTQRDTPDKIDYERLARVVLALEHTFRALDATLSQ